VYSRTLASYSYSSITTLLVVHALVVLLLARVSINIIYMCVYDMVYVLYVLCIEYAYYAYSARTISTS
jgi:hypothetical protein